MLSLMLPDRAQGSFRPNSLMCRIVQFISPHGSDSVLNVWLGGSTIIVTELRKYLERLSEYTVS